jgi:hypothetical protein
MMSPVMQPSRPAVPPSTVTVVAVMMAVLAFLHFCGIGSGIVNLVALYGGPDVFRSGNGHAQGGERMGQLVAYVLTLAWSVIGLVWAPLNAWALFTRKPWARTSVIAYSAVALATCCCLPFGAFGIYAMLRRDVKDYVGTWR